MKVVGDLLMLVVLYLGSWRPTFAYVIYRELTLMLVYLGFALRVEYIGLYFGITFIHDALSLTYEAIFKLGNLIRWTNLHNAFTFLFFLKQVPLLCSRFCVNNVLTIFYRH